MKWPPASSPFDLPVIQCAAHERCLISNKLRVIQREETQEPFSGPYVLFLRFICTATEVARHWATQRCTKPTAWLLDPLYLSLSKYRTASSPLASLLTFPISFFLSGLINAFYFSPNRQRSPPSFLALLTSHHTVLISHNSKHPTALLVSPFRSWALWDPLAFSDSCSHLQPKPLAGDSQTCPGQRYAHLLL